MIKFKEVFSIDEKSCICNDILRALPHWFGIESSIVDYTQQVQSMLFFAAFDDDKAIGFIALKVHNPFTAEVCVMGVLQNYHRLGTGKKLITLCEERCIENNIEFLTVKTLDESRYDEGYEKTRLFYLSMGFRPLETFPLLWDECNPCLFMVKIPKKSTATAVGESLNRYVTKTTDERMLQHTETSRWEKVYTIIGGVNGTGKSSFTGVLMAQDTDLGVVIDVDKITAAAGVSPLEGGKIALRKVKKSLDNNLNFLQETTLSGYRTKITASNARQQGYYIRLYYIGLNTPEECISRIANRAERGGHDINQDVVLRRFAGRWGAVNRILPYCNEARFFDNDNGFVEVAEYRNGELILKSDIRPAWVIELSEYLDNMIIKKL